MPTKNITRLLKYDFSDTQLEEMSTTVFENIDSVVKLKAEKKETNRDFSDRIKTLEQTNIEFGHLIQEGHEYRDIACEVEYNKPTDGKKTITRMDDHTQWVEDMEPNENTIDNLPLPGVNTGFNDEEE